MSKEAHKKSCQTRNGEKHFGWYFTCKVWNKGIMLVRAIHWETNQEVNIAPATRVK